MFTKRELLAAIKECENAPANYQCIEKLAHLYTVYDHLYTESAQVPIVKEESIIGDYGESDFLQAISGQDATTVWALMDELMDALKVLNPKLYDNCFAKLKGGGI